MNSSILQVVSMQDIPEKESVKKTGTPCHKEFRSFVVANRTPMSKAFLQSWGNTFKNNSVLQEL